MQKNPKNFLCLPKLPLVILVISTLIYILILNMRLSDSAIVLKFSELFWKVPASETTWFGVQCQQNPCDAWVVQEIVNEVKPDYIIEVGTFKGGYSLYLASVLSQVNPGGKVITIDIENQVNPSTAERELFRKYVEFIQSDSVSPKLLNELGNRVRGRKVLVFLDSLHTPDHVLKELNLYSKLVSIGSYLIVHDTIEDIINVNHRGPLAAIKEFMKDTKDFIIDSSREKFLITFSHDGFLKRIR